MKEVSLGKLENESQEKIIERAKSKFELVNSWISNCDAKSSFLLAFYGVIIAIVFTSDVLEKINETINLIPASKVDLESAILFISLCALLGFLFFSICCFYFIYKTLKARLDSNVFNEEGLTIKSLIFFMSINELEYAEFKEQSNTEEDHHFLNDLNSQIFINSKIATKKFNAYNKSIFSAFVGFACFIVFVLFN